MRLLEVTKDRRSDHDKRTRYRLSRMVSYPPPSTGTNYNLVDRVEHDLGDRIIWHIIYSPAGRFVYDYHLIRVNRQYIERMCLDCRKVKVRGIKRLCKICGNIRKRASNRKSQSKRRSSVRTTGFSCLRAEALTNAVETTRYVDPTDTNSAA